MMQPVNRAAASVTVIDRDMIRASGATQIVDLLRLVPGFQVSGATIGSPHLVAYHGQSDLLQRGLEVMVDGASVYSSFLTVDWQTLGVALEDIERIEVLRGGGAPTYGYNAFTSTINIITRKPIASTGVYAGGLAGSRNTRSATARYGAADGALEYRLTGKFEETDGNRDRSDGWQFGTLNFRGQVGLGYSDELDIDLSGTYGEFDVNADLPIAQPDAVRDSRTDRQRLRWTRTLDTDRDVYVQFYRQYSNQDDRENLGLLSEITGLPPGAIPTLFDGRSDQAIEAGWYTYEEERHDLEVQYRDYESGSVSWVLGAGGRQESIKSAETFESDRWKRDNSYRAFAQASIPLSEQWLANIGGVLERGDLYDTGASYRVGVNYFPSPDHTLRLTYSHAERKPTLFEEYFNKAFYFDDGGVLVQLTSSQGGLEPEELDVIDVGYIGQLFNNALLVDLRLFYERLDNQIRSTTDTTSTFPGYLNNGVEVWYEGRVGVDTWGLEGQLKTEPWQSAQLSFQFAFLRSEDRYDPIETGLASRENHVPDTTLSLLLSQSLGHQLDASLVYYYLDDMSWNGDATLGGPSTIKSTHRLDVRIAKQLGQHWLVEGIAQNLASRYEEGIRGESAQDPRYLLRVSAQY
ncbi:TonB-dependent receptor plug domain-containing protein [Marinobacter confluentis]|nr:TonB-dependent receptor [Marinobacter confluentis]